MRAKRSRLSRSGEPAHTETGRAHVSAAMALAGLLLLGSAASGQTITTFAGGGPFAGPGRNLPGRAAARLAAAADSLAGPAIRRTGGDAP